MRRKFAWAATPALLLAAFIHLAHAQAVPPPQPNRPGAPSPTTPGERTTTPAETPQRSANPPHGAPQQTGAPPLVPNAYASTYKPLPSRTTVIRNATILTATGPAIDRG